MKKTISVLLSLISVICIAFALGGCQLPTIDSFTVGTYETYEVEGEPFIKAKFILRAISKEEFESSDGINVIKNDSKSKSNKIYYSFELFVYDDVKQDYEQIKILNIRHVVGTPFSYDIQTEYESNGNAISEMSFVYITKENKHVPYIAYTEPTDDGGYIAVIWRFKLIEA